MGHEVIERTPDLIQILAKAILASALSKTQPQFARVEFAIQNGVPVSATMTTERDILIDGKLQRVTIPKKVIFKA
jgi:hypothetical protein